MKIEVIMPSVILNVGIFLFVEEQGYKPCPEKYFGKRNNFFMKKKNNYLFCICTFLSVKRILKSTERDLLKMCGLSMFDCFVSLVLQWCQRYFREYFSSQLPVLLRFLRCVTFFLKGCCQTLSPFEQQQQAGKHH